MTCDTEIEDAYRKIACIVAKHGEIYIPVFERIENELFALRRKNLAIQRASEIANSSNGITIK